MKGDSCQADDQGNVVIPRPLMDQIADTLLFYVRGFELLDEGLIRSASNPARSF